MLILELWSFWVNEVHMRNSMEGTCWSEFEGLNVEYWTCPTTLSWNSYCFEQGWITVVYPVKWQRISRLHLSPSTLPGGPGDRLGVPEKVQTKISLGVVGRNNLLKLLSPHLFDRFYLFKFSYYLFFASENFKSFTWIYILIFISVRVK